MEKFNIMEKINKRINGTRGVINFIIGAQLELIYISLNRIFSNAQNKIFPKGIKFDEIKLN